MFSANKLPDTISIFPLPGALLLPRTPLPLHIFEPRYLAMLDDALKTSDRLIGMVQPLCDPNHPDRLHDIGCAGRITAFSETDDGRYMITLTGISRFRIRHEIEGFVAYRRCEVGWSDFERDCGATERDAAIDRPRFFEVLERFFRARELESDWDSLRDADDELLINSLSMLCPFEVEEKQALLEAPTLADRRETLCALMEYAVRGGTDAEVMQ